MDDKVDQKVLDLVNEMLADGANKRMVYVYPGDINYKLPEGHIVTVRIRVEKETM